jgi:putative tricarboxylic transport membrane protein
LLIGVAFIILIKGVLRKPGFLPEAELSKGRVILSLVAMFAYPFILEPLGYLLTTFLFMIVLLRMMVKKAWWFTLVVACLISPISYILFKVFLKVALPVGLMGF